MRARPKLYDFVHFTLKAFSRLMDEFSLTNSNCELSACEIPGTSQGRAEPAAFRLSIFFPRAARSGALINYHRRLKLYCRRSLGRTPRIDCKRRTHGDRKFPSCRSSFVRKFLRRGIVREPTKSRRRQSLCSPSFGMPILKSHVAQTKEGAAIEKESTRKFACTA